MNMEQEPIVTICYCGHTNAGHGVKSSDIIGTTFPCQFCHCKKMTAKAESLALICMYGHPLVI